MRRLRPIVVLTTGTAVALTGLLLAPSASAAAPPPPTGVSVTVATTSVPENNGRFTVSWAPVTGALAYRVTASLAGVAQSAVTVSAPATSGVLTGLAGGTRYQVTVSATNDDTYGPSSTPQDATALTVPSAPTDVRTDPGTTTDDTVTVSWGAPVSNGGAAVQNYKVEQLQAGGTYRTLAELEDDSFSYVVQGDDKPNVSDYRITASNIYGWSSSSQSAVPPNAPRSLARTVSGSSLTATWQAPLVGAGQLPIAGYVVQVGDDTQEVSAASLTYTKTGLANGTYALAVVAFDVEGNEGAAAATTFTITSGGGGGGGGGGTGEVSNPPTGVRAEPGDASATVSWTAPTVTGSFPVTNYRVTSTPASNGCVTATTSCKVSGLTNGTTYTFTVAALTGAGYSKESSPSNAVTPKAAPGPSPSPSPSPTPTPTPSPSPTVEIDAPARVVAAPGDDVRVVLQPSSRIKSSLLRALIVVQGKNRPLDAAFRNAGKNVIMTFEVSRKPGTYKILIGQRIQGDFAVLGETRLVVRKGRRSRS